jgi:hypothetical protein
MPIVAMPDGTQVQFPDDMPKEKIRSLIEQKFPNVHPSGPKDVPLSAAITDIPSEIAKTAGNALSAIKQGTIPDEGPPSIMDTGRAIVAVPQLIASPVTGAFRSVAGHLMAQGEHQVGKIIAPEIAAKDDLQKMFETSANQAETALSALGPRGSKQVPAKVPTSAEIKSAASQAYDSVKTMGVEVKADSVANTATRIKSALEADGIDADLADKTFKTLDRLENAPAGGTFTINNLRTTQRKLGRILQSPDPTERLAAARVLDGINKHFENLTPGDLARGTPADAAQASAIIKEANANYKAAKTSELLDAKKQSAELDAGRINSGQNLDNKLRARIYDILKNDKLKKGFSPEQVAQMESIVKGTAPGNVVRAIGNLLGGGGGYHAWVTGLPTAGIAPGIGWGVKKLGNALTSAQVRKLDEMVRASAPLSRGLRPGYAPQANSALAAALVARNSQLPASFLPSMFMSPLQANAENQ